MTTRDNKGGIDLPQDGPDSLLEAERLFKDHGSGTHGSDKPRGMHLPPRDETQAGQQQRSSIWKTEGVENLPVEDAYKWWPAYFRTCWMIIRSPKKAFALPAPTDGGHPWKFILSTNLILMGVPVLVCLFIVFFRFLYKYGPLGALEGTIFLTVTWGMLFAIAILVPLAGLAIGGAGTHLFIKLVHRQAKSLPFTYRAIGYSMGAVYPTIPFWLMGSPLINEYRATGNTAFYYAFVAVNLGVALYIFYVQAVALAAAHGCGKATIVLVWAISTAVVSGLVYAFVV